MEQAKLAKRKSEVPLNANEQEADLRTDDSPDCERVEPTEREQHGANPRDGFSAGWSEAKPVLRAKRFSPVLW